MSTLATYITDPLSVLQIQSLLRHHQVRRAQRRAHHCQQSQSSFTVATSRLSQVHLIKQILV